MAKRFTDSDLFKKKFIRGLEGAYKLLWIYIQHDCDHAGIWEVDFEVASIRIGSEITEETALEKFGASIVSIDNGDKWFIPSFIEFQYGVLNDENRAHKSVLNILEKHSIKGYVSPLQGGKDMDMDKDKVKELDKVKDIKERIEKFSENVLKLTMLDFVETAKFVDYWTEYSDNAIKCRWEKEKVFDIKKRLERWDMNKSTNKQHGQSRREKFAGNAEQIRKIGEASERKL